MSGFSGISGQPQVNKTIAAMQEVAADEQVENNAEQITSQKSLANEQSEMVNPFASKFASKKEEIKAPKTRIQQLLESEGAEKGEKILPLEHIKDQADQFNKRNQELNPETLALLREQIKEGDSKEDILKKLAEFYSDPSLADEALEFLLQTTDGELFNAVKDAKEQFTEQFGREIAAGRNIAEQARLAAEKGLGTPTSLRDLYSEITGNPRDSGTLFEELSAKYTFKELKKVVDFLLHSLGADMKSKGSSIPRGMLHRLLTETRSLQAILGVYRFFRQRMKLLQKMFDRDGMEMPSELNFETLAQEFMIMAAERYPNPGKVLQRMIRLGIDKWIQAKIAVLMQMRDAVKAVAVNQIYKSLQHRDDLYLAILEALEDLEDQLEDLLEKEEENEELEEEDDEDDKPKDTIETAKKK
jgi:type III secretion protein W